MRSIKNDKTPLEKKTPNEKTIYSDEYTVFSDKSKSNWWIFSMRISYVILFESEY